MGGHSQREGVAVMPMPEEINLKPPLERRRWAIGGQVQGVGFRPFVYRLATQLQLTGWVANNSTGVVIEAQGLPTNLARFAQGLRYEPPPLARIDHFVEVMVAAGAPEAGFQILASDERGPATAAVTPDTALCHHCRQELFESGNRRFRHALITCTNCGPRYSIMVHIPYDRPATTMADFTMCPACGNEYRNPLDRRFHAQPIACPDCGPRLALVNPAGEPVAGDPIAKAAELLRNGSIVAIKGLGGFHLAVRADDPKGVARLRRLKHRDAKPFALMCGSVEAAGQYVTLSPAAAKSLVSPAAPIILARRLTGTAVAPQVAPFNARLGMMLAYTPIQHLLMAELNLPEAVLVMTSGNSSDEPLVIDNAEAVRRLGSLCDAILWHDRPIARCVDDSVLLDMGDNEELLPIRRSRGFAPTVIPLVGTEGVAGLALGGELKNTVTLVTPSGAIVSQHLGDIRNPLAFDYFRRAIDDLCSLYQVHPHFIACDLHPLYVSTGYAATLAKKFNATLYPVQHHHAHAAAVLAEHGQMDRALALIGDGSGLGTDGTGWGGELLLVSPVAFTRLASLQPLRLPGGDIAAKEIRRSAVALLWQVFGDAGENHPLAHTVMPDSHLRQAMFLMMRRNWQCVTSSSMGRLFDALAALLNLCTYNRYEAEAAMALDTVALEAAGAVAEMGTLWQIHTDENGIDRLDLALLWRFLLQQQLRGTAAATIAALFYHYLAAAWDAVVAEHADKSGVKVVALSGGVLTNQVFAEALTQRLARRGLRVLRHHLVPPTDGGLSLGQAFIAASLMARHGRKNREPKECQLCV